MSDVTEFLLARITEREERARKRMHHAQQNHLLLQDPKYLGRVIPGWYEWPEIEADAAHVLAECEAKRRTLALLDEVNEQGIPRLTIYTRELLPRLLALPYADHPDYRQEWRP